ncbi:MAG TPA: glycosyltransferase family 2 protein [Candidatus Aminicenantes bacterium]|nr:glycosyltransferase family 2 protein [Candidatus Aminicenantes bacterium]
MDKRLIGPDEVVRCNPQYRLVNEGSAQFFENCETGGRILTDAIGKTIFNRLAANAAELQKKFEESGTLVSVHLLRYYLHLLCAAGIACLDNDSQTVLANTRQLARAYRVSCVIVTYNSMRFIGANLQSLFEQTVKPYEVIVSDNGSRDGTLEFIRQHYPRVTVVENKRNLHYTGAVNAGARRTSGDMILILNDDVVMDANFLAQLLLRFEAEVDPSDVVGVTPQIRLHKTPGFTNGIGNVVRNHGWGADNFFGVVDVGQFEGMRTTASACFAAVLIKKEAWEKVGEMDENFQFYDDVDWSFRAHMRGLRWLVAPRALIYHAFGGTYPSGGKITLVVKSRQRFVLKNLSGRIMLSFFRNYLKEDWRNLMLFMRNRRLTFLRYLVAYAKLMGQLPGLIAYRLTHRRPKKADIIEFDQKSPPLVVFADAKNRPILNAGVIRSYYYYLGLDE